MKFSVNNSDLKDVLLNVISVVPAKTTFPIIGNILLNAKDVKLYISATDLEVTVGTFITVEIEEEGGVALPARIVGDIVRQLPNTKLNITIDENKRANIKTESGEYIIAGENESEFPELEILHIADCCAFQATKQGFSKVGLIGTKPTMEEDYLKSRLARHGITTLVPQEEGTREEIYEIIYQELSYNVFRDESRTKMVKAIHRLEARGAEACILGCTEIELLVGQEHIPSLPLLPSAEIHIQTAANVLLERVKLEDVLPPDEQ